MQSERADAFSLSLTAWALALVGWGGLVMLVFYVDPRLGPLPLWGFFVLWLMALTGTAVPFVNYLSRRFSRQRLPADVILRTALWVGFFGATCAWLQRNGLLNGATVALIAIALIGVEWFLRLRDRSRRSPDDE
ncbi:MAG: hypothetical protein RMK99_10300 [Anaerolineales bacterium]|nr:hypothetical protein [Anaerolineales bacterium]